MTEKRIDSTGKHFAQMGGSKCQTEGEGPPGSLQHLGLDRRSIARFAWLKSDPGSVFGPLPGGSRLLALTKRLLMGSFLFALVDFGVDARRLRGLVVE